MKSDILRRQNFSSTTFNGTLHLETSTAVVQQSYLQPILSLFPSSHVHNFLPILQSVHFCRSIQSLFNENVPSGNLSLECVFEKQSTGPDADPPYSSEWVAVVGSVCLAGRWLSRLNHLLLVTSTPSEQVQADVNLHSSSQFTTPLRTIVCWQMKKHDTHSCTQLCTLYELVRLTNLEMALDSNARRMRLSWSPPCSSPHCSIKHCTM